MNSQPPRVDGGYPASPACGLSACGHAQAGTASAAQHDAEQRHEPRPATAVAAPGGRPAKERRVLLVDDEQGVLSALRRLLRNEPYELSIANNGPEALKLLEAQPAQLVVSDQLMPEMTGLQLLREIRRRWPETVGIILSGYTEVNTIIRAINEGEIYKFLTKPWNDEELKLNLRRAMEQYTLQSENRRMSRENIEQNRKLRELNELLNQRAADAAIGLSFAQQLLECLDIGVIGVDDTGTVVWANRRAVRIIRAGEGELIGGPIPADLPEGFHDALASHAASPGSPVGGRCTMGGRSVRFRVSAFETDAECRGTVAAFWEDDG